MSNLHSLAFQPKFQRPEFTKVTPEQAIDDYQLSPPGSLLGVMYAYPNDRVPRLRQVYKMPAMEGPRGELVRRLAHITNDAQLVVISESQISDLINYMLKINTQLADQLI